MVSQLIGVVSLAEIVRLTLLDAFNSWTLHWLFDQWILKVRKP